MAQYIENLHAAMKQAEAGSLTEFVCRRAGLDDRKAAAVKNLEDYAAVVTAKGSRYSKAAGNRPDVKTARPLPALDCAAAPCVGACPTGQDIPAYLERAAAGDFDGSLSVILAGNPLPNVLGKMCNQACRNKCMRAHYDQPLRIRDVKRCAAETGRIAPVPVASTGRKVAVVGAGPAGLSCASFLASAGCAVEIFEAEVKAGGRTLGKMTKEADRVARDVQTILDLGVALRTGYRVDAARFAALVDGYDAVYDATGEPSTGAEPNDKVVRRRLPAGKASSLVESVGEGRRAAGVLLAHLGLFAPEDSRGSLGLDTAALRKRQAFRHADVAKSVDPETAREEAGRCLQCDAFCGVCVGVCPNRANLLLSAPSRTWPVQEAAADLDGGVRVITLGTAGASQPWQVLNLGDFCNECGNCAAFCPSSGAPYRDKMRLHLSRESFAAASRGFHRRGKDLFEGKGPNGTWTLRLADDHYIYEDARLLAKLDGQTLAARDVMLHGGRAGASLADATQAAVFCRLAVDAGVRSSE